MTKGTNSSNSLASIFTKDGDDIQLSDLPPTYDAGTEITAPGTELATETHQQSSQNEGEFEGTSNELVPSKGPREKKQKKQKKQREPKEQKEHSNQENKTDQNGQRKSNEPKDANDNKDIGSNSSKCGKGCKKSKTVTNAYSDTIEESEGSSSSALMTNESIGKPNDKKNDKKTPGNGDEAVIDVENEKKNNKGEKKKTDTSDDSNVLTSPSDNYNKQPVGLFKRILKVLRFAFLFSGINFLLHNFWFALLSNIILNVAYGIFFSAVQYPNPSSHVPPFIMIIADFLLICLRIWDRYSKRLDIKIFWGWFTRKHVDFSIRVFKQLLIFLIVGIVIWKIVLLIGGTIANPLNVSIADEIDLNLSFGIRLALILVASISILADLIVLLHLWTLPKKGSGSFLIIAVSCVSNFFVAIIQIKLYHDSLMHKKNPYNVNGGPTQQVDPIRVLPVIYMYTSAFILCGSSLGLGLAVVVNESNRLSETIGRMTLFVDCYFFFVTLLALISCLNSLQRRGGNVHTYPVSIGIPTLYGVSFVLCILIIICSRYTRSRLPPSLEVEVLDLEQLTEAQKNAYAKLITFNVKSNPGVSGDAVLLLMEAYTKTSIDGMNCKVLRVYRPPPPSPKDPQNKSNGDKVLSKQDIFSSSEEIFVRPPKKSLGANKAGTSKEYEVSKTWEVLDIEKTVFDESETVFSIDNFEPPKPLSKNQRKKLAKKAAAAGEDFPSELQTEEEIKERAKFHSDLMATEALVLLTSIDNYDLTSSIQGKFGNFLRKNFGFESKNKLLCIRFGLLAFHWPFIRSTFYCSNSRKPVARSAAVMYAINCWNKAQTKADKCTILLDPTYKNAVPEQAIKFGGWLKIPLPASHIIDLRPYKNKTISEYFKAIKYRNQDGPYRQADGVTVEEKEFTEELCELAMSLWRNIADNRTSNGNTSVLIDPNAKFLQTIGTVENSKYHRTLLFLKVDGEAVASCLLFRLGDTITSDLQGLHQEKARPMKAYFVMMQEVITIALKEGKSFVDFGPTTAKPKLDIGCQDVPLTGALRTSNIFLSICVIIAAGNVNV